MPRDSASCLTGGVSRRCPRPAGLSGWVTTAMTSPASSSIRSVRTANSGEPMNTVRSRVNALLLQVAQVGAADVVDAQHALRLGEHLRDLGELAGELALHVGGEALGGVVAARG